MLDLVIMAKGQMMNLEVHLKLPLGFLKLGSIHQQNSMIKSYFSIKKILVLMNRNLIILIHNLEGIISMYR
jgi:hypothetical protein